MKSQILLTAAMLALSACGYTDSSSVTAVPITSPKPGVETLFGGGSDFNEVGDACDGHGHRVYIDTSSSPHLTVITDASCPGGVIPKGTLTP